MAVLDDLIQQIKDPELRDRIQKEADRLLKQKKLRMVFGERLPVIQKNFVPTCWLQRILMILTNRAIYRKKQTYNTSVNYYGKNCIVISKQ